MRHAIVGGRCKPAAMRGTALAVPQGGGAIVAFARSPLYGLVLLATA
jgi:hypothetical protein